LYNEKRAVQRGTGDWGGGFIHLRNVTVVAFYYLLLLKLLNALVIRPSSGRNIFARITQLTTDPLFLEYSERYGSL
jgi:hypothetical protein